MKTAAIRWGLDKPQERCDSAYMVDSPANVGFREVMDIRQAAKYLGISTDTLYKYASERFVPSFKLGNRWRFRRVRLDEWMKEMESRTR